MHLYALKLGIRKYNISDFADKIGYNQSAVSRILNGKQEAGNKFLTSVAFVITKDFNIPIEDFENGKAILEYDFSQHEIIIEILSQKNNIIKEPQAQYLRDNEHKDKSASKEVQSEIKYQPSDQNITDFTDELKIISDFNSRTYSEFQESLNKVIDIYDLTGGNPIVLNSIIEIINLLRHGGLKDVSSQAEQKRGKED